MENKDLEFKVFGKNIESISLYYGILLIFWGIVVSYLAKSSSFTSYIPSYLGTMIILFTILSIKFPIRKKVFMHIVALVGLLTFIGGLDVVRLLMKNMLFVNFWADLSKIMMLATGQALFLYVLSHFAMQEKLTLTKLIKTFVYFCCKFFNFIPICEFICLRNICRTFGNKHD